MEDIDNGRLRCTIFYTHFIHLILKYEEFLDTDLLFCIVLIWLRVINSFTANETRTLKFDNSRVLVKIYIRNIERSK